MYTKYKHRHACYVGVLLLVTWIVRASHFTSSEYNADGGQNPLKQTWFSVINSESVRLEKVLETVH